MGYLRRVCALAVLILLSTAAGHMLGAHPVYVSMCQIRQENPTDSLRINITLFTEDLEQAIYTADSVQVALATSGQAKDSESRILGYLAGHLDLRFDQQPVNFRILSTETLSIGRTRTSCRFALAVASRPRVLEISNRLLLELYEEQSNLVRIFIAGEKKVLALNRKTPSATVSLD